MSKRNIFASKKELIMHPVKLFALIPWLWVTLIKCCCKVWNRLLISKLTEKAVAEQFWPQHDDRRHSMSSWKGRSHFPVHKATSIIRSIWQTGDLPQLFCWQLLTKCQWVKKDKSHPFWFLWCQTQDRKNHP